MTEQSILRAIRLGVPRARPGCVLWRNARGYDDRARQPYGLAPGGADLIGIYRGRFVAVEVKRAGGGTLSREQHQFLDLVRRAGGIAVVARSVEDVCRAIDEGMG